MAGDVEEDAAADHPGPRMLDAEHVHAAAVDAARVVAVVHLVVEEDVAERVPVRRGLHRHVDGVVGEAQLVGLVEAAGDGVGAGREHGVDRVPAPAEEAALRTLLVQRDAHGEDLALAHEL